MPPSTQHDFVEEHCAAPVQSRRTALPVQIVVQPWARPPGPQQASEQSSSPSHARNVVPTGQVEAQLSVPEVALSQHLLLAAHVWLPQRTAPACDASDDSRHSRAPR